MSILRGWIGVDLDGTLAEYHKWGGLEHVGAPVPKMLERVKLWLQYGQKVKIMTARVSPMSVRANASAVQSRDEALEEIKKPIKAWCLQHVGQVLEITHEKDLAMIQLWDDRCVQVIPNTGERADGRPD